MFWNTPVQESWKTTSTKEALRLVIGATLPNLPVEEFKRLCHMIEEDHCPSCGGCHLTTSQISLLLPEELRHLCHGTYSCSADKEYAAINLTFRRDMNEAQWKYFTDRIRQTDRVDRRLLATETLVVHGPPPIATDANGEEWIVTETVINGKKTRIRYEDDGPSPDGMSPAERFIETQNFGRGGGH
jgi:hypothetical protein